MATTSLLARALASDNPAVTRLVSSGGRLRDRLDHPQLRDARRLLRSSADVVLMGESVLTFVGPDDVDHRPLPRMVADGLPGVTTLAVHGGGYHAELLTEYVRLLATRPSRPKVVVVPLWLRGRLTPWIEHPRFGHVDAMRRLRALEPSTPPWRVRGSLRRETSADFERYYALPYASLLGERPIGDYARPLKSPGMDPEERLRLLYAFHHGSPVLPEGLVAVTALGEALRHLGSAWFAYETPVSVQTGERVLGPDFRSTVTQNFTAMRAALGGEVIETGTAFDEDAFIDPTDGSEHLNDRGRTQLAALLLEQIRKRLDS
jgi:hypothetical protein